jgi:hypothetical protein
MSSCRTSPTLRQVTVTDATTSTASLIWVESGGPTSARALGDVLATALVTWLATPHMRCSGTPCRRI